ncbi:MAG: hypothetical protein J0L92_13390 [Deltaproteobacteria bacterium]|nr:hypothetical protein [Deltaproteobacteria bacterium]
MLRRLVGLLASLFVLGCGDPGSSDAGVDAPSLEDAPIADDAFVVPDAGPSGPARALFDLDAVDEDFFAFPFPSDLRLDPDGTPSMEGFPASTVAIVASLLELAETRPGWPTIPVAFFRFTAPLAPRAEADVMPPSTSAPFLLVDVDPSSPDRGALVPTIALTLTTDRYTGSSLVAVAAVPGWVLHPNRQYAFVIQRSAMGWDDGPIEAEPTIQALLRGEAPSASWGADALTLYAPLRETLSTLGVPADDVATATVFTTADVVADLRTMVDAVRARDDVSIEGLALDPSDGDDHPRYCELLGTVSMPQFQEGTPVFDTEGHFVIGEDGLPIEQRRETARVVVTIPRTPMPAAGYPLHLYIHGSGGLASQVVDRGPYGRDGIETPGEGPAHVVAEHGIAAVGTSMPLSPDRVPGASSIAYLNFGNLDAFPFTFHQGVMEQALLLDALATLRIPLSSLGTCTGVTLPPGETEIHFDFAHLVGGGQSMGAMYLNMLAAIDGRITALVPTGAGGFWSYMILETELISNTRMLLGSILRTSGDALSHLHPAMHVLQLGWESADPMVFMPRISRRPLEGITPRPIYEPVGRGDSYFPTVLFDAMALAYGHRQAGTEVWPTMQPRLAWAELDGLASYPVAGNLESESGVVYTGAVIQSAGDGFSDGHNVFMQVPEIRFQWGCFLRSSIAGTPTIPAPAAPGSPCMP